MPLLRECKCGRKAYDSEDLELFVKRPDAKHGRKNKCKECAATEHREKFSKNYEAKRVRSTEYREWYRNKFNRANGRITWLKRAYNLDNDIVGSECEICGRTANDITEFSNLSTPFVVDHNHKTGQIRGTLCGVCNMKLGKVENMKYPNLKGKYFSADRAKEYLLKYNTKEIDG